MDTRAMDTYHWTPSQLTQHSKHQGNGDHALNTQALAPDLRQLDT